MMHDKIYIPEIPPKTAMPHSKNPDRGYKKRIILFELNRLLFLNNREVHNTLSFLTNHPIYFQNQQINWNAHLTNA